MIDISRVGARLLSALPPELAHRSALAVLRRGLVPSAATGAVPGLDVSLWTLRFANPIGLAAGFDKNAEVPDRLLRHGFGFVEVGTVTPRPQSGNRPPRLFRLGPDRALINRLGFNNDGMAAVAKRLESRPHRGVLGVNIGANADSSDPIQDYVVGFNRFAPLADYLVVNISSPNTPGLRDLQARDRLQSLLAALHDAREDADDRAKQVPLLVKIAPDLADADCVEIAETIRSHDVSGLIISNTTTERPEQLRSAHKREPGGLSGRPLFDRSTRLLARFHQLTAGDLPLIGVGGVANGADAYAKIRAGASLVQLYTALIYEGLGRVRQIQTDLAGLLAADGFGSVAEAVGTDRDRWAA